MRKREYMRVEKYNVRQISGKNAGRLGIVIGMYDGGFLCVRFMGKVKRSDEKAVPMNIRMSPNNLERIE